MKREMGKYRALPVILLVGCLWIAACGKSDTGETATREVFAMDTYMSVTCYGTRADEAADKAVAEIERLDGLFSVGEEKSDIAAINRGGERELSEDTQVLLREALLLSMETGGAFDITVYPLMELWGFTDGHYRVPSKEEVDEVLKSVGSEKIMASDLVKPLLREGQGIDFGGIAKGYTSQRIMQIFEECEIDSGIVSLGGNVQCRGRKPDGSLWRCGIRNPLKPDDTEHLLGVLTLTDKAVVTSGSYERFFTDEETQKTYHHIIDPGTGYPAERGILSATVVSEDGTAADALSTALFVMGKDRAETYWRTTERKFDFVLMTNDGEIYITEGLEDCFESEFSYEVISGKIQ